MDQVTPLQDAYLHQLAALPEGRPAGAGLREVRWMLEEYRVSLFAQQLGTAQPVSDQRIRKALARIRGWQRSDAAGRKPSGCHVRRHLTPIVEL